MRIFIYVYIYIYIYIDVYRYLCFLKFFMKGGCVSFGDQGSGSARGTTDLSSQVNLPSTTDFAHMWCKYCHIALGYPWEQDVRRPPCGPGCAFSVSVPISSFGSSFDGRFLGSVYGFGCLRGLGAPCCRLGRARSPRSSLTAPRCARARGRCTRWDARPPPAVRCRACQCVCVCVLVCACVCVCVRACASV